MQSFFSALVEAFKSLFHPKIITLVLWPMLASSILWLVLAIIFWGRAVDGLTGLLHSSLAEKLLGQGFAASASHLLITFIVAAAVLVLIYLTALAITAIVAMPVITGFVEQQYYPGLERKAGATLLSGIAHTVFAIAVYCAGLLISLPLWVFFPLSIVLPVLLMAWLNTRLFSHDALAQHASEEEYGRVAARSRNRRYALGLAAGLMQFVPVFNLFLPVYMGLAFSHLCLGELERERQGSY
jgi:hypothetical protein